MKGDDNDRDRGDGREKRRKGKVEDERYGWEGMNGNERRKEE